MKENLNDVQTFRSALENLTTKPLNTLLLYGRMLEKHIPWVGRLARSGKPGRAVATGIALILKALYWAHLLPIKR